MYDIELTQEISASADRVWDVLTAFREYDEWNPIITRMRATLVVGAPISFVIAVGGREVKIKAELMKLAPGVELRWFGPPSKVLAVAVRGEHYFRVEPQGPDKCRLVHGEHFSGFVVPFIWRFLEADLKKAYGAMNRALKARAESVRGQASSPNAAAPPAE
jgi:hypothetical protein